MNKLISFAVCFHSYRAIRELTKEGKIKTLIDITRFLDFKDFDKMTKEDIFSYLNRFRK